MEDWAFEKFALRARAARIDDHTWALKCEECFAVFDRSGNIQSSGLGEQGFYFLGTRFLSHHMLRVEQQSLFLLGGSLSLSDAILEIDLTHPDLTLNDQLTLPRSSIHFQRRRKIIPNGFSETLRIQSFLSVPVSLKISLEFASDFADVFEVRGLQRRKRGEHLSVFLDTISENTHLELSYRGLDNLVRKTCLVFHFSPTEISSDCVRMDLPLEAYEAKDLHWKLICSVQLRDVTVSARERVLTGALAAKTTQKMTLHDACQIETSSAQLQTALNRSLADLKMLLTETPYGPFPYAGLPWHSTVLARSSILVAFQTLWFWPDLARSVLSLLAASQARSIDLKSESSPGKIIQELRTGEMANVGEIPFARYYGAADTTPLFVCLAEAYFERTGDLCFLHSLSSSLSSALNWMDECGEKTNDSYISCQPTLIQSQHGWREGSHAIVHANGERAQGPFVHCEVQAFAYSAKLAAARLAAVVGEFSRSERLEAQARRLQIKFQNDFWCEDISQFALALDFRKMPCRVVTSLSGICLWAGIATQEQAEKIKVQLFHPQLHSGWGVRSLASDQTHFNPLSFHNGGVWPGENSFICAGLKNYGFSAAAHCLADQLISAILAFSESRVPEVFAGFERHQMRFQPSRLPLACCPSATASGAAFLCLQTVLGLQINGTASTVSLKDSELPAGITELNLRNLRVGSGSVDFQFKRQVSGKLEICAQVFGNVKVLGI